MRPVRKPREARRHFLKTFSSGDSVHVAPCDIQMHDGKQLVSTWQATNPIREETD